MSYVDRGKNIQVGSHVRRGLAWELNKQKDNAIGLALSKPEDYLKMRNNIIVSWFQDVGEAGFEANGTPIASVSADQVGPITRKYNDKYKEYLELGYPEDVANQKALESSKREYDERLEELEIRFPGALDAALGTGYKATEYTKGVKNADYYKKKYKAEKERARVISKTT